MINESKGQKEEELSLVLARDTEKMVSEVARLDKAIEDLALKVNTNR